MRKIVNLPSAANTRVNTRSNADDVLGSADDVLRLPPAETGGWCGMKNTIDYTNRPNLMRVARELVAMGDEYKVAAALLQMLKDSAAKNQKEVSA